MYKYCQFALNYDKNAFFVLNYLLFDQSKHIRPPRIGARKLDMCISSSKQKKLKTRLQFEGGSLI